MSEAIYAAVKALDKALAQWKAVMNATAAPAWRPPPVPPPRTPVARKAHA